MNEWWREAVFYQIYPRSFADANGDGIGDLAGIESKLDYLNWLGIDALWISPHYPSPQKDCGYDVSDYRGVAPEYGTPGDFRRLLDAAHDRGLRVVIDLVLNHSSNEHPWFLESASSKDSPKRDWYVWHSGRDGGNAPPNNWNSIFGGSAWERHGATGEWYYHYFLKEQPDLNWRNPELRAAMFDMMRYWLDLGADGFRIDAIPHLFEDRSLIDHDSPYTYEQFWPILRDAKSKEEKDRIFQQMFGRQEVEPELMEVLAEIRSLMDEYGDRFVIGETERLSYLGDGSNGLHAVFCFDVMFAFGDTLADIPLILDRWMRDIPSTSTFGLTSGNHDRSRIRSLYSDQVDGDLKARTAAALVLTLPGIPFLYYGEEIGMEDLLIRDTSAINDTMALLLKGRLEREGASVEDIQDEVARFSRDRCRTPMQWTPGGGFASPESRPWLPYHPNAREGIDVESQKNDPDSFLSFYRRLLALRRDEASLRRGEYRGLRENAHYVFTRGEDILVEVNLGDEPVPAFDPTAPVLLSTLDGSAEPSVLLPSELKIRRSRGGSPAVGPPDGADGPA